MSKVVAVWRVKRNGNSFQIFKNGEYWSSLSVKELCQLVEDARVGRYKDVDGTKSPE